MTNCVKVTHSRNANKTSRLRNTSNREEIIYIPLLSGLYRYTMQRHMISTLFLRKELGILDRVTDVRRSATTRSRPSCQYELRQCCLLILRIIHVAGWFKLDHMYSLTNNGRLRSVQRSLKVMKIMVKLSACPS